MVTRTEGMARRTTATPGGGTPKGCTNCLPIESKEARIAVRSGLDPNSLISSERQMPVSGPSKTDFAADSVASDAEA
ncbi:hypothetical protein AgCh_000349 [Apium graveolens]